MLINTLWVLVVVGIAMAGASLEEYNDNKVKKMAEITGPIGLALAGYSGIALIIWA
jgi:hypothetical protein